MFYLSITWLYPGCKFKCVLFVINIDAQNFHRKLGVFPEINRVWVTIDQEFFLWDYSEGSV